MKPLDEIKYFIFEVLITLIYPIINLVLKIIAMQSWVVISQNSKNKKIQTVVLWLFFLPTIAKITEKLGNTIIIYGYELTIQLPFSWFYLYFSALFLFLFQIYTLLVLPKIYKDNNSYEDFERSGKNSEDIRRYSNDFKKYRNEPIPKEFGNQAMFWQIWNDGNYEYYLHRCIISLLYYIGIFFIGFVIVENFIYVYDIFSPIYNKSSLYVFYIEWIKPLL